MMYIFSIHCKKELLLSYVVVAIKYAAIILSVIAALKLYSGEIRTCSSYNFLWVWKLFLALSLWSDLGHVAIMCKRVLHHLSKSVQFSKSEHSFASKIGQLLNTLVSDLPICEYSCILSMAE